jgi:hypothetical protein
MWIIHKSAVSDEQQDLLQQLENRFRSGGINASEFVKLDL